MKIKELRSKDSENKTIITNLRVENNNFQKELQTAEVENKSLKKINAIRKEEQGKLSNIKVLEDKVIRLQTDVKELLSINESLHEQLRCLKDDAKRKKERNKQLIADNNKLMSENSNMERELNAYKQKSRAEIKELKAEIKSLKRKKTQVESHDNRSELLDSSGPASNFQGDSSATVTRMMTTNLPQCSTNKNISETPKELNETIRIKKDEVQNSKPQILLKNCIENCPKSQENHDAQNVFEGIHRRVQRSEEAPKHIPDVLKRTDISVKNAEKNNFNNNLASGEKQILPNHQIFLKKSVIKTSESNKNKHSGIVVDSLNQHDSESSNALVLSNQSQTISEIESAENKKQDIYPENASLTIMASKKDKKEKCSTSDLPDEQNVSSVATASSDGFSKNKIVLTKTQVLRNRAKLDNLSKTIEIDNVSRKKIKLRSGLKITTERKSTRKNHIQSREKTYKIKTRHCLPSRRPEQKNLAMEAE